MLENIPSLESSRARESAVSRLVDAVANAGDVDVEMTLRPGPFQSALPSRVRTEPKPMAPSIRLPNSM
jgi:hypothetical protein